MSDKIEVRVPELGDFKDVDVVEILVAVGDRVAEGDSLIALETDKASMEVPAPTDGTLVSLSVEAGGTVNEGDVIAIMEAGAATDAGAKPQVAESAPAPKPAPAEPAPALGRNETAQAEPIAAPEGTFDCDLLVLGSGPGGYTAAFRGADLGLKTVLVERDASLGGVCLNVGCIPSKALLHSAKVIDEAAHMSRHGIVFGKPEIQLDKLRAWKDGVVGKLTGGIRQLAKSRKVDVVHGTGSFVGPHEMQVSHEGDVRTISFRYAVIAAGSRPVQIPGFPYDDPRLMDSTGALELADIPERLLVIGGGIIGLEMATVYEALGTKVTVVELLDRLMMGADRDMVRPFQKRMAARFENIYLESKVTAIEAEEAGLRVRFEGEKAPSEDLFDRVLLSVGRAPNGKLIGAAHAGVAVDERGFIAVDNQQRTNVPHIFAIGDIVGQPMLAHKATHEGKVAAEVAAGHKSFFDARVIPSVAYTDPEVAWVGVTEEQAKAQGLNYGKGTFPWAASGRSLALGRDEGVTKLLFDKDTGRVIGAAAVGTNAGEIIAEAGLAIEMGCDAEDIGLTVHAHPTLSETVAFAAEAFEGTITDLYIPRKKKK
ncbi:dihydrolipoyl dehydrogenase [Sulfidibacter corallicola]|uniref:Dihydrolipoyl dehydrogenase n=1 Tax=Sulfidibacter corallicola TaxID=2818388 RepID=A0A8A4TLS7_SULCO|nr:dihydrolipoyl dehydrogenase [Sulfidibacter corallicola]